MTDLLLVSGLGRCGSTLMMSMLDAGGYPIFERERGGPPGYEHPIAINGARVRSSASGAVKWLCPMDQAPPPRVRGSIFMVRNHHEQSRSHHKFLTTVLRVPDLPGWSIKRHSASLARDEPRSRKALARRGPVMVVRFERLVADPRGVLTELKDWLRAPMDVDAAASVLLERETGSCCLPYLLELTLIENSKRGRDLKTGLPR